MPNCYFIVRWPVDGLIYLYDRSRHLMCPLGDENKKSFTLNFTPDLPDTPDLVLPIGFKLNKQNLSWLSEYSSPHYIIRPTFDVRLMDIEDHRILAYWHKVSAQTAEEAANKAAPGWMVSEQASKGTIIAVLIPGTDSTWERRDYRQILEVERRSDD